MKGSECKFVKYMEGADKRFVIPVYQRNYDWKTENCKQLYDDLVKIVRNGRKSHFFGSLVSVYNPEGNHEEFLVIDGQQRLTTVSLLFLAMYNLIREGIVVPEASNLMQRIYEEYLVDKWQPEDTRIKLKPVKNDQTAFSKLFSETSEHIRESNLTVNYEYFYDRIQKQEITIDQLYAGICRLEIINIRLDKDDDPQLIFESLNSTGLDLSEGDKIRNFILMGLPTKTQETYYEKYWNPIELCTHYDVSAFIRDYLSVKQYVTPQHLTPVWQQELGADYEQIHEQWLHRIANLTLTAYNARYSNSSFTEKKNMEHGFKTSGIRMNMWIAQKDQWTQEELQERNDYLMGWATKIWAAPESSFRPVQKQLDAYTLEDEAELTGRQIARFSFKHAGSLTSLHNLSYLLNLRV